jgi:hypothetical protein
MDDSITEKNRLMRQKRQIEIYEERQKRMQQRREQEEQEMKLKERGESCIEKAPTK